MKLILFLIFTNFLFPKSIYEFELKDNSGKNISISEYKGKNILIVNVASQCGFTYQYEALEKLYQKYKSSGFEILAFPSNDFGAQEPGTDQEIREFCKSKFGVSFKLFSKISVSGKSIHPMFKEITNGKEISWNFEKFLFDKNGKLVERFTSSTEPFSSQVTKKIDNLK